MKQDEVVILAGREAFLDAFCMQYGVSIVSIDRKLAEIPNDNPNKAELMRYRQLIASANAKSDMKLVTAWLHALMIGLKAATHTIPLALVGEKFGKGKPKGANGRLRKIVQREHEATGRQGWKAVISAMESSNDVDEVDWAEERVWLKGESGSRSFKTIKNIISEL
ncbi:hypothetical protein [Propionivibrio sp.]|uniref:hypothetical protein n=1 Tax=Propionivibrio sp. TaxID=2212460 RepID=UPI00272EE344|nr:hypothetical protein [Propionivibrio sp.]